MCASTVLLCFTEESNADKILRVAHGHIKFCEELLHDLALAFRMATIDFVQSERTRLALLGDNALSAVDAERLAIYSSGTYDQQCASLVQDNVNFQLWYVALRTEALALLAFREAANMSLNERKEAEALDRAALKETALLVATTGQYKYTLALPQQIRTLLMMPAHLRELYIKNFVLPGKTDRGCWHDAAIEEENLMSQTNTRRVTMDNVDTQLDELGYVKACDEGLRRGLKVGERGLGFERVKRQFGSRVDVRVALRALITEKLFGRFHEDRIKVTLVNLFKTDNPELNSHILERRSKGRERLREVGERILNVAYGGKYNVPLPDRERHWGALPVEKVQKKVASVAALTRQLRAANSTLAVLLGEGNYMPGPHCWAEWDASRQQFVKRHGNKSAQRQYLNQQFGGHRWELSKHSDRMFVQRDGHTPKALDVLTVDFLMLGRRVHIRDAKAIDTAEQLAVAAMRSSVRPMWQLGFTDVYLHADQATMGTIEKGATVAARNEAHGGNMIRKRRSIITPRGQLPPTVPRTASMFAKMVGEREVRGELFAVFPSAFSSKEVVEAMLPYPNLQRLHFLGFHPKPSQQWWVGRGAEAAIGATTTRSGQGGMVVQSEVVEHLEADTSVFYSALHEAVQGKAAIVWMEDTDALWIGPLAWVIMEEHLAQPIKGELFVWLSPQVRTVDGEKWDHSLHAGKKEWHKEELLNVRERVAGIATCKELMALSPLKAVLEITYASIFCGGDTTAFFHNLPHARCFELLLKYRDYIGDLMSPIQTVVVGGVHNVPKACGNPIALERLVKVLYVAGPASSNGRGANWPKFLQGRQTLVDELAFLHTLDWPTVWQKLIPAYIHTLSKLPPSTDEISKQVARSDYRINHWMRAYLKRINLDDLAAADGFMPQPGSGQQLTAANVAFRWGTPEDLSSHIPQQLAKARRAVKAGPTVAKPKCLAIVGPKSARRRCKFAAHAGESDEIAEGFCSHHKEGAAKHPTALREGEQWEEGQEPPPAPPAGIAEGEAVEAAITTEDLMQLCDNGLEEWMDMAVPEEEQVDEGEAAEVEA